MSDEEQPQPGSSTASHANLSKKRKRGPYKGYLRDNSISIPRTTMISRKKQQDSFKGTGLNVCTIPEGDESVLNGGNPAAEAPNYQIDGECNEDESEDLQHSDTESSSSEAAVEQPIVVERSFNETGISRQKNKIDYIKKYRLNGPLHSDFSVSKLSVLLMILHLAVRHCNTQAFVEDQIRFVNALFDDNVLDISYYIFKELFKPASKPVKHYFCPTCHIVLSSQNYTQDSVKYLICSVCQNNVDVHSVDSHNYFITLSVKDQIKALLQKPDIKIIPWEARCGEFISDLFDGLLYKKLCQEGYPLSNVNALTVTFNTDGVAVQSSTKNSLWPIWLYVNEVCPKSRFKTENLILAGLWFGKSSPNMALFLKPFCEELIDLAVNGVDVVSSEGIAVNHPVFPVSCSVDSVAKAKVLCQKMFSGYSGCLYCLHPNDTVVDGDTLHRHYDTSTSYDLRTDDGVFQDMLEADKLQRAGKLKDSSVNGFVGISVLTIFARLQRNFVCNTFDIVWGVVIDYLHCLLEGVSANLLDLFESLLSDEDLLELNQRIFVITPPQSMTRKPRSFKDKSYWKAKEYRAFMLYYALPCLEGLLGKQYYANLKLFVSAIHILLSDKITHNDLQHARLALNNFTVGFQKLYGIKNVTFNLHLCTHLVDMVARLGPLWCYSNFVFESGNGILIRLIRGTRTIVNEIATKYMTIQSASEIFLTNDVSPNAAKFCSDIMNYKYSKSHETYDGVHLTGSHAVLIVTEEESRVLKDAGVRISENNELKCFNRVIRDGVVYCSKVYSRSKVFDDSCVMLQNGTYATIDKILKSTSQKLLCVVQPIRIVQNSDLIPQIMKCAHNLYDKKQVIQFSDVRRKCMLIRFHNKSFICKIPNFFERD